MCGRIFHTHAVPSLTKLAQTNRVRNRYNFNPTYNMGPTNYIPAIRAIDNDEDWDILDEEGDKEGDKSEQTERQINPKRGLDFMKWGYQTSFSLIINARAEEVQDKPTFRPLLNTKRCVVMAEGYYEWNKKKEPFLFQRKDKQQLMMAALFTDNDEVFVLTRDSFGEYEKVHDRMPVLLEDDEIDLWINMNNKFGDIIDRKILNQQKKIWGQIDSYKVAPHVNSIREKSDKCIISIEEYKIQSYQKGLGRFFSKKDKQTDQVLNQGQEKIQQTEKDRDKIEQATSTQNTTQQDKTKDDQFINQ